jgi:hypothetical protein
VHDAGGTCGSGYDDRVTNWRTGFGPGGLTKC